VSGLDDSATPGKVDGIATLVGVVNTLRERRVAAENAYEGGAKQIRNLNLLKVRYKDKIGVHTERQNRRMNRMERKIKIFTALQDISALEVEVNNWLSENQNVRIIHILQTESTAPQERLPLITFLYETG
jgi:hypothetical protein